MEHLAPTDGRVKTLDDERVRRHGSTTETLPSAISTS